MANLRCVTANLNKAHNPATMPWLERTLGDLRPALFFGQELKPDRLKPIADAAGYTLLPPQLDDPSWWMGSWILVREDLPARSDAHKYWSRFECYVAAGFVTLPDVGEVRVVSAHASPTLATTQDRGLWGDDLPIGRTGPTGRVNALSYADLVLHALKGCAIEGPLLAAGDFNESRHYNVPLGSQFFELVERCGLVDVTFSRWQSEQPTRFFAGHPELQLDHVFATPDVDPLIVRDPFPDPDWISATSRADKSDHAPLWFELSSST